MQEIKQLLRDYIAGMISSEEFANQYIALFRALRDERWAALDRSPKVREQLSQLYTKHLKGRIPKPEYEEKWIYLTNQLEETRLKPYSKEGEILSHLFVEADAYREDPEIREPGLHIGDAELKAEVQKAIDMLN